MAEEADNETPLELTEIAEPEDQPEQIEAEGVEAPDDAPLVVSFDGEEAGDPAPESNTIREMRAKLREANAKAAALEAAQARREEEEVGERPTIAGCDYDEERFEAELTAYQDRKRKVDARKSEAENAAKAQREEFDQDYQRFEAARSKFGAPDYADAQTLVEQELSGPQQSVLVMAATDTATLVYALGKSPAKLAELKKITNPIKLAAAIARLEKGVQVVKRNSPKVDRPETGSAALGSDKRLAELERQAEKSGDRTALIAYKAGLKKAK